MRNAAVQCDRRSQPAPQGDRHVRNGRIRPDRRRPLATFLRDCRAEGGDCGIRDGVVLLSGVEPLQLNHD